MATLREGQRIIAVAHGTLIRLALNTITDGPKREIMRNCEIVQVDVQKLRDHFREPVH
mgnify:CR=1 FL=1